MSAQSRLYLTDREREVMMLVAHGYQDKEIAGILRIAVSTVWTRLRDVRFRLGAKNRTHAVWLCVQYGLLNPHVGVVA
jgi:DNA-binding CsgD family transcriptional regulator